MARIWFLALTLVTWQLRASVLPGEWTPIGRVQVATNAASLTIQGGFLRDVTARGDGEVAFRGRAPAGVEQVQIWAGLRCRDRDSRYVFALRGGNDNDVYLARYAPGGEAKFLGFAPLDFKPAPGTWYSLRAVSIGRRIQIYLNDETLPRINIVDSEAPWTNGGACLGGGWLPAEFADVQARSLTADEQAKYTAIGGQCWAPPMIDKEALRKVQRAAYKPAKLDTIGPLRTELSLDGGWLFMPDYGLETNAHPAGTNYDDTGWHVMPVPEFWTPGLSWLHGETGFPDLTGVARTKGVADSLTVEEERRVDGYTFDWRKTKAAWYRHHLELPVAPPWQRFFLTFDAIAKISEIWVNGTKVGSHTGLFGQVVCDISSAIHAGDNVIAVHATSAVDSGSAKVEGVAVTVEVTSQMLHSLPHGMFQDDVGGIWQPVKLTVAPWISVSDCFINPSLHGAEITASIRNAVPAPFFHGTVTASYTITDAADNSVLFASKDEPVELGLNDAESVCHFATPALNPKLWSPQELNLYNLEIQLKKNGHVIDSYATRFGFRTFTTKGSRLLLNGKPFWLRGGNPFPNTLRPNDAFLARHFMGLARHGNVTVTRSHIVPFTSTWLDAADETGMAVSFEGTWPWLMLRGAPPSPDLLQVWKDEFLSLIREHRNHPSLVMWTVNNEMKFESADAGDPAMLAKKWRILDDMIRAMRAADPSRPIVADSSYVRKEAKKGYKSTVQPNHFDDGDIDDGHRYYGWYNETFYHFFDGQYGRQFATPGRPFISQEMATGYPNNDDGHPTRFYLFKHQTPQAFVGDDAWENADPSIFLTRQAFLTKELAETFRRSSRDTMAGILHFAYFTWLERPWSMEEIEPGPAYYGLKRALQPVLVSAELFGRHFYAGSHVRRRVCIANDAEDFAAIPAGRLKWEIRDGTNVLSRGGVSSPSVKYYENRWMNLDLRMPAQLPRPRVDAKLVLTLENRGGVVSENAYDIVLATREWARPGAANGNVLIIDNFKGRDVQQLRRLVREGGRVLLVHPGAFLKKLYPEKIKAFLPKEGEIATMHVPESPVFDGIEPLDLAWLERGGRKIPLACTGVYRVSPHARGVTELASHCDIHGYLQKPSDLDKYTGSPLVEIREGKGLLLAGEMCYESAPVDPIAGRLYRNAITYLENINHDENKIAR